MTFSPFEMAGFSIETGEKLWWAGGLPPQPKSTPLVARRVIYSFSRSFFGDSLPTIPGFAAGSASCFPARISRSGLASPPW